MDHHPENRNLNCEAIQSTGTYKNTNLDPGSWHTIYTVTALRYEYPHQKKQIFF